MKEANCASMEFVHVLDNKDGKCSFIVYNVRFGDLYWILRQNRSITKISGRRFFFWSDNMRITGLFNGMPFEVTTDPWEADTFWFNTAGTAELPDLASSLEAVLKIRSKVFFADKWLGKIFGILLALTILRACLTERYLETIFLAWWGVLLFAVIYSFACIPVWHHIAREMICGGKPRAARGNVDEGNVVRQVIGKGK